MEWPFWAWLRIPSHWYTQSAASVGSRTQFFTGIGTVEGGRADEERCGDFSVRLRVLAPLQSNELNRVLKELQSQMLASGSGAADGGRGDRAWPGAGAGVQPTSFEALLAEARRTLGPQYSTLTPDHHACPSRLPVGNRAPNLIAVAVGAATRTTPVAASATGQVPVVHTGSTDRTLRRGDVVAVLVKSKPLSQGELVPTGGPALSAAAAGTAVDAPDSRSLLKTKLCRHYERSGTCRNGSACGFAHGDDELRAPASPVSLGRTHAASAPSPAAPAGRAHLASPTAVPARRRWFIEEVVLLSYSDGGGGGGGRGDDGRGAHAEWMSLAVRRLETVPALVLLGFSMAPLFASAELACSGASGYVTDSFMVALCRLLGATAGRPAGASADDHDDDAAAAAAAAAALHHAVVSRALTALVLCPPFRRALAATLAAPYSADDRGPVQDPGILSSRIVGMARGTLRPRVAVLRILRLALEVCPESLLTSFVPWLQTVVEAALVVHLRRASSSAPHAVASEVAADVASGYSHLLAALGGRLPLARAAAPRATPGARTLVDLDRPSHLVDWRRLPLVPTAGDILEAGRMLDPARLPGLGVTYGSASEYLETLLRLLRADGLRDIVDGVSRLHRHEAVDSRDLHVYDDVRVVAFRASGFGVQAAVTFRARGGRRAGDLAKAGRLMDGNLLALSLDGSFATPSLMWATVAPATARLLPFGVLVLDLLYDDDDAMAGMAGLRAILQASAAGDGPHGSHVTFAESPAYFTAMRYALEHLHRMANAGDGADGASRMPLLDNLVYLHEVPPPMLPAPRYSSFSLYGSPAVHAPFGTLASSPPVAQSGGAVAPASRAYGTPASPATGTGATAPTATPAAQLQGLRAWAGSGAAISALHGLDDSQRRAVITALSHRVSCTQGPPGTGKTFTSARFAHVLLSGVPEECRPNTPILMLAAKNHALDQFLSRLLPLYPGAVVRVGGRAETEELAAVNLTELRAAAAARLRGGGAAARTAGTRLPPDPLRAAWAARGKAFSALKGIEQQVRGELEPLASRTGALTLATLCAHMSLEQLTALLLGAMRPDGDAPPAIAVPDVPGVDFRGLYAGAIATAVVEARAAAEEAASAEDADAFAAAGGGGGGGGGAAVGTLDVGPRVVDLLRRPLELPPGAQDAWATVGRRGRAKPSGAPTPHDALVLALRAWAAPVAAAPEVAVMFGPPGGGSNDASDAGRATTLLQVRPTAGVRNAAADNDDGMDEEDVAAALAERLLLDDDDGGAGNRDAAESASAGAGGGGGSVRAGATGAAGAAAVAPAPANTQRADQLIEDGFTLIHATADGAPRALGSGALAELAFVTLPWSDAFALLDEPAEARQVDALAAHEEPWDWDTRQRAIVLHRIAEQARQAADERRRLLAPRFAAAAEAARDAALAVDVALLSTGASRARIIGMTVTGAAKNAVLLEKLGVTIVIVEEAAEVAEPLLVAALPITTQHLYMAGDHKQLPPQPNCNELTKHPFNFSVSLFERLVNGGMAHTALNTQNRMAPALADLVRAARVYAVYLDRAGIADERPYPAYLPGPVWWWAHNDAEDDQAAAAAGGASTAAAAAARAGAGGAPAADDAGGGGSRSRSNRAEAARAAAVAVWHMLNGTHPSRITVLAPYTGQVHAIRRLLRDPTVLPADVIDAARMGLPEGAAPAPGAAGAGRPPAPPIPAPAPAAAAAGPATAPPARSRAGTRSLMLRPSVADARMPRVCTIDEFQGDEADHIVLSLTRCNGARAVGFLSEANRITVALSRARRSLVIVGAPGTFGHLPHFDAALRALDSRGARDAVLPLHCARHPAVCVREALTAGDIPHALADTTGMCQVPCGAAKPCGHGRCARACHVDDPVHAAAAAACTAAVLVIFPHCGHRASVSCPRMRSAGGHPPCPSPCRTILPCKHVCVEPCGSPCTAVDACPTCIGIHDAIRCAEVQRRAAELRAALDSAVHARLQALAVRDAATPPGTPLCKDLDLAPLPDPQAQIVLNAVARSTQPGHGFALHVTRIERVTAPALERRQLDAVRDMHQPDLEPTRLFHGTRRAHVEGILRKGFRVQRERTAPGASHATNMLGAAVYLAPDSSKAAREEYTGADGVLLLCDAFLGSIKVVASADATLDDPAKRALGVYDSAHMRTNHGVAYDEYAVFDPALIVPRFVIHFRRVDGASLPRALAADATPVRVNGDVTWHRATAADFVARKLPAALREHFMFAQTYFVQLAESNAAFGTCKLAAAEVCNNPRALAAFEGARATLQRRGFPFDEVVVFHGTAEGNIADIQLGGFRIGGVAGHAVAVGTVHGHGIYTGISPDVSAGYARGAHKMLVVRVLLGRVSNAPLTAADCSMDDRAVREGAVQSHAVGGFANILASPVQALPMYVVEW